MQLGLGLGLTKAGGLTLTQQAINILRRPGLESHVYMPGVGWVNGFSLSNAIMADGSQPAVVDQPLGYLGDAAGDTPVINATQATTANKPILRRGPVNRLLNSATLSTQSVAVTAQPYTLHFAGTGTVTLSGASTAGPLVGTGASNRVSLTFTPTAGSLTLTVSGSVTSAMLQTGSVATAYVPTTTAAASSPTGPYWMEFDGTDFLSLVAVPFQVADDYVVVAGFSPNASSGTYEVFSCASTAAANPTAELRYAAGNLSSFWRSDAGTIRVAETAVALTGVLSVVALRKVGNTGTTRRNGAQVATVDLSTLGTTTINAAAIGARPTASPANHMLGGIYPVIVVKGTVSDAELAILERYVAQASGVTI